jgi:hypothetical protein
VFAPSPLEGLDGERVGCASRKLEHIDSTDGFSSGADDVVVGLADRRLRSRRDPKSAPREANMRSPWHALWHLIRDRDGIYGKTSRQRVLDLGIEQLPITPRSFWQNLYARGVIGTLRRECLDNVVVLHERHLRTVLRSYIEFHHQWRIQDPW